MSVSKDVEKLESRLRQAERIIANAYTHAVACGKSGELAKAICDPLVTILTESLETENKGS